MKKNLTLIVSEPTQPVAKKLTKEDVWGKYDTKNYKKISDGMIVAQAKEKCPIFKDNLPYKSVTVVCKEKQQREVEYWLEYVHGGECVSKTKKIGFSRVAIRSNYMCW